MYLRDADRGWRSIASTRFELVAGDNALRVVLPSLVSIRAVASLELVGRTVHLRPSGEREDGWQPSTRWARVNEDGQVKFAAVPAGEYRIVPSWSSNAVDVVTSFHSVVELPTVIKETSGTARDEPDSRTTGRSGSAK